MSQEINTHGLIVNFGRHKNTPWTRVPVSYLHWLVGSRSQYSATAQAELNRRGTTNPELDISGHAIDRASTTCRKIWHETKLGEDEGLHSWLCRICAEALKSPTLDEQGRYLIHGVKLAIDNDGVWPVLKTVMPIKRKEQP